MPMDKKRYPKDWAQIAAEVKEKAGWQCQKCGKKCRKPGEPFDTHRNTLTVAHLNHTPEDCRPENLMALCAPCHLRYDAKHHAETRKKRKMVERQVIVTWYTPEEKLPEKNVIVVATVSGQCCGISLDHALVTATFCEKEGWLLEEMEFDTTFPGAWLTVHAWADLDPYKG